MAMTMDALRVWRASSQLMSFASRATIARSGAGFNFNLHTRYYTCSSPFTVSASATATSDRRRRTSSSPNTSDRESVRAIRLKKVEELRQKGYEPYAYTWDRSHTARQIQQGYGYLKNSEVFTGVAVSLAGRVVARRAFGKLVLLTLRDDSGTIQLYCEKECLSEDQFAKLKSFVDIGDILGASGSIKKTEKGELSVYVKNFEILTKSLLPLPDKFHGLTDIDKRYRQRIRIGPPWNLSQRSNPLHFGGRLVKFPRDLQEVRLRCLPIALDFSSATKNRRNAQHLISERTKPILDIGSAGINEKFLNLPNLVSISRMVSGPVIGLMIMNEWYVPAFGALIVSGATDWLDGFLARKMGINSVYGSYLDPLADKVLIGCVALSMVKMDLLHPGLVGLVVFRDIGLVGGAVSKRVLMMNWKWDSWSEFFNLDGQYREKVEPLFISKVNTVLQLLLVAAALLQPDFGTEETQQYLTYLSWLVASTTVASTVGYGIQYFRNKPIIR